MSAFSRDTEGGHHRGTDPMKVTVQKAIEREEEVTERQRQRKWERTKSQIRGGFFQIKKCTVVISPSRAVLDCGAAEQNLHLRWRRRARNEAAKQEFERSRLWKGSNILWNTRPSDHIIHEVTSAWSSLRTRQTSLMLALHHWLEITTCFRGVHLFSCTLVTAGRKSRREESRHG